jgi:hypothetical protein
MMDELSGGQAAAGGQQHGLLLQQDGSPHLAASPQPAVTIQELSDSSSPLKPGPAGSPAAASPSVVHMAFAAGQFQQQMPSFASPSAPLSSQQMPPPLHESPAAQAVLQAALRAQGAGSPHTPHDARVSAAAAAAAGNASYGDLLG